MATTRYEVPPGGGFYLDIPGIWAGGEVFARDDETGEITIISRAADQGTGDGRQATVDEEAAAKPQEAPAT